MSINLETVFNYSYSKDGEFIKDYKNISQLKADNAPFYMIPLGTIYCSILNSKFELQEYLNNFNLKYSYTFRTDIKIFFNSLITINKDIVKISPFLNVITISLLKLLEIILVMPYNKVENLYKAYKKDINKIFNNTINSITEAEDYYYGNGTFSGYDLPRMSIIPIKSGDTVELMNSFIINDIDDLLRASAHALFTQKYHLKKCHICGKYFTTKRGQTRFCDNPCPYNEKYTCRTLPKNLPLDEISEKYGDMQVNSKSLQVKRINERFRSYAKREKNIETKNIILCNKKIFLEIINELRPMIRKCEDNKKIDYYTKIYENFLNEVDNNLKKSPPNYIIKRPKY